MNSNIIRIGNSRGIILPSEMLKQLHLSLRSKVDVLLENGRIIIQSVPREGWAEAARKMSVAEEDTVLMPDVFEDEYLDDWVWEENK
ncbi:MAG: AbrB/MazE/SpoVT family DNA-binding domain-containing protein [Prevotellaceae bacterium]|jgi:antitoxin MazE|nr:AbrB/MazE/SpoVT family DNA-binding domain-containing protein [Prevotellaceae bacterium]